MLNGESSGVIRGERFMTCEPRSLAAAALFAILVGCKPQVPPTLPAPPAAPPKPPRAETVSVEAAGMVGYNAGKVRGKVDAILDQNDERNRKLNDLANDPTTGQ